MQTITVLGSTGSIGKNTLDVLRRHRDRYRVFALCAHTQVETLLSQCREFHPRLAVIGSAEHAALLSERCRAEHLQCEVRCGAEALAEAARHSEVDVVMAAIVGAAGLAPTLAAAEAGKRILLANKEVLVMAGQLFTNTVRRHHATLLPVDSEHNAIFQSLPDTFRCGHDVFPGQKILLTASGGPFRGYNASELTQVTPAQACSHPNWSMGKKISIDSATLMNKGLEVIEAHWLFACPPGKIEVLIHPQSILHSGVYYADGSLLAQLGQPDMRTPIAQTLAWPQRIASGVEHLDLLKTPPLSFHTPDHNNFPCLGLAYHALHQQGSSASNVLNAANEVSVAAFLDGKIHFPDIARINAAVLQHSRPGNDSSIDEVWQTDKEARELANYCVENTDNIRQLGHINNPND